jgi:hypothetical protein
MYTPEISKTKKNKETEEPEEPEEPEGPEETADKNDPQELVYDHLFGEANFNEPGYPIDKPEGRTRELEDWSNLDLYDKPVTCIMFSNFLGKELQFSESAKIRLRLAVKLVSVMTERILQSIKPTPRYFNQLTPVHAPKINPQHVTFEFQLMKWFGSDSAEIANRVRAGILIMHKVLTDPLEIITFVNDCAIKNNPGDGVHQHPGADNEDFGRGFINRNRRATLGHTIYINDSTTLEKLQMSGMMRYIFHELTHGVLDLPTFDCDRDGYMKSARINLLSVAEISS